MPQFLDLGRCPWCKTANPTLEYQVSIDTTIHSGSSNETAMEWILYKCSKCQFCIMGVHEKLSDIQVKSIPYKYFPYDSSLLSNDIPENAQNYLQQAKQTIHSPDASILVCASALDIMLQHIDRPKEEGSLSKRIQIAAEKHQITEDMAKWAHLVRTVANDSRHPTKNDKPATVEEAKLTLEFALALAEFLFVLPARVEKGIEQTKEPPETN